VTDHAPQPNARWPLHTRRRRAGIAVVVFATGTLARPPIPAPLHVVELFTATACRLPPCLQTKGGGPQAVAERPRRGRQPQLARRLHGANCDAHRRPAGAPTDWGSASAHPRVGNVGSLAVGAQPAHPIARPWRCGHPPTPTWGVHAHGHSWTELACLRGQIRPASHTRRALGARSAARDPTRAGACGRG